MSSINSVGGEKKKKKKSRVFTTEKVGCYFIIRPLGWREGAFFPI